MSQFNIEQWLEVCSAFSSFFKEVDGEVHIDEETIASLLHPRPFSQA